MPVPLAHTIVYYVIIRNGHADSHERSLREICEQLDEEEQGACASETCANTTFTIYAATTSATVTSEQFSNYQRYYHYICSCCCNNRCPDADDYIKVVHVLHHFK